MSGFNKFEFCTTKGYIFLDNGGSICPVISNIFLTFRGSLKMITNAQIEVQYTHDLRTQKAKAGG